MIKKILRDDFSLNCYRKRKEEEGEKEERKMGRKERTCQQERGSKRGSAQSPRANQ